MSRAQLTSTVEQNTGGAVAPYVAGKNAIINGDFAINQRAFTSSTTSGTYGFDRWKQANSGGTVTYSAQTFTAGAAPVTGYEGINFARLVTSGQSAAGDLGSLNQRIESVRTLAGQTVTISFWAKTASAGQKIAVEIGQVFGTTGSPSSDVNTYFGQATLTTSWVRYSVTGALPSISGKTITTSDQLALNLWVSAGTTFNSRTGSLGIQNGTFDIWGVQIEAGPVATPFTTASGTLQGELALCQRYYWRTGGSAAYQYFGQGATAGATTAYVNVQNPVIMRATPTSIDFSTLSIFDGSGTYSASNVVFNVAAPYVSNLSVTISGATANRPALLNANNSTSAYLGFSAEL